MQVPQKRTLRRRLPRLLAKAKVQWARVQGHTVHNLQHDGVILRLDWGEAPQRVAQQLSAVTAHALGYAQPVKVKS